MRRKPAQLKYVCLPVEFDDPCHPVLEAVEAAGLHWGMVLLLWRAYGFRANYDWKQPWRVPLRHLAAVVKTHQNRRPQALELLKAIAAADPTFQWTPEGRSRHPEGGRNGAEPLPETVVIHWGLFHSMHVDETYKQPSDEQATCERRTTDRQPTDRGTSEPRENPAALSLALTSPPSGERRAPARATHPGEPAAKQKKHATTAGKGDTLPERIETALNETFGLVRDALEDRDTRRFLRSHLDTGTTEASICAVIGSWKTPQERGPAATLKNFRQHFQDRQRRLPGCGSEPAKTAAGPACADCGEPAALRWEEFGNVYLCGECANRRIEKSATGEETGGPFCWSDLVPEGTQRFRPGRGGVTATPPGLQTGGAAQ